MRRGFLAGLAFLLLVAAIGGYWIMRPQEQVVLSVAGGPEGSDSFTLLEEIAAVARRRGSSFDLVVVATTDSSRSISAINSGEVELAAIRNDTPVIQDVRLVATLFADKFQLIVRRDSGIGSVDALKGKRIALPPAGSDALKSFFVIVDHYDLDVQSMHWSSMPLTKATDALLSGAVDAIFTVRSLRDAALLKLVADAETVGLALDHLPINQAEAITLKRPQLSVHTIPLGALGGATPVPSRARETLGVERVLVAREDVPENAVRQLTALLFENRLELTTRFSLAAAITQPDLSAGLSMPMHDGAESFYNRDEPSFIQENAEPLALGVTVLTLSVSMLLALRSRFSAKQKNRADIYNHRLLALNARAIEAVDVSELDDIRRELSEIMAIVVTALDTDEVTESGFQAFSRIHESVAQTARDRRLELRAG